MSKPKYKYSEDAYYDPQQDIIYAPDSIGEFYQHEYFHARPNITYLQTISPYYENLNDQRLQSMGADLNYIKRSGDPNIYYSPEEIGARVAAAKYVLNKQGINITKDFIKASRQNDSKWGDNYRDLLHMYNDNILYKLFSYKDGGTITYTKFFK